MPLLPRKAHRYLSSSMHNERSGPVRSPPRPLRIVAVLAVRNEQRFVAACLENLIGQGVEVYLCDNGSTDRTVEIATPHLGKGLVGIEHIPYDGVYQWQAILRRKETLFRQIDADWLMHVDADEIHLPPLGHASIVEAIAWADAGGYESVEFSEFTFVPTQQAPDHDHAGYLQTLRTYYPFEPRSPHCVRAFRKQDGVMEIAWSGGHRVRFPHEPRLCPTPFRMKHYLFLSAAHAAAKYPARKFNDEEVGRLRWHGWRPRLRSDQISLPSEELVRRTSGDEDLDHSRPWKQHWLERCAAS